MKETNLMYHITYIYVDPLLTCVFHLFQHFEPSVPMGQGTRHQINCEYLPVVPHKAVAEISKKGNL